MKLLGKNHILFTKVTQFFHTIGTFNLPTEMTSAMSSGIDLTEYLAPLQLMVTARHFFKQLIEAAGEKITDDNTFGLHDLLTPESRRLKYFLSHFINYWLLCNSQYQGYQGKHQKNIPKYFSGWMSNSVSIFLPIFESRGPITASNQAILSRDWFPEFKNW